MNWQKLSVHTTYQHQVSFVADNFIAYTITVNPKFNRSPAKTVKRENYFPYGHNSTSVISSGARGMVRLHISRAILAKWSIAGSVISFTNGLSAP